jgi:hypothetical protein
MKSSGYYVQFVVKNAMVGYKICCHKIYTKTSYFFHELPLNELLIIAMIFRWMCCLRYCPILVLFV